MAAHLLVGVATISRSDSECLHVATDYSNRINITAQHVLVCDSHVSVCYQLLLAPVYCTQYSGFITSCKGKA